MQQQLCIDASRYGEIIFVRQSLSLQLQRNSTSANITSWKLALTLFLITLLSRWPLHSRLLYDGRVDRPGFRSA